MGQDGHLVITPDGCEDRPYRIVGEGSVQVSRPLLGGALSSGGGVLDGLDTHDLAEPTHRLLVHGKVDGGRCPRGRQDGDAIAGGQEGRLSQLSHGRGVLAGLPAVFEGRGMTERRCMCHRS